MAPRASRNLLMNLAARLPVYSLLQRLKSGPSLNVLVYHHIPSSQTSRFRRQIEIVNRHYTIVDPSSFMEIFEGKRAASGTNVLLTFDDGYNSHVTAAEDVLDPMGIKALFFVPTGFVKLTTPEEQKEYASARLFRGRLTASEVSDDLKPLTWSDLETLKRNGHTIGAHTATHPSLPDCHQYNELATEIVRSADELGDRLGTEIEHFAFPFGSINDIHRESVDIIRQRFRSCFSSIRGNNISRPNSYSLFRDPISLDDPTGSVHFVLSGGLNFLYRSDADRLLEITS